MLIQLLQTFIHKLNRQVEVKLGVFLMGYEQVVQSLCHIELGNQHCWSELILNAKLQIFV